MASFGSHYVNKKDTICEIYFKIDLLENIISQRYPKPPKNTLSWNYIDYASILQQRSILSLYGHIRQSRNMDSLCLILD